MATQLPDGVQLLRTLTGHGGTIGRIGWSPDGRLLATPSADGTIRIWDAASGECVRVIRGRHVDVFAAAFDPDGRILATGGDDGTELWDVESWELRTTLESGVCNAVAFSPRDRILATAKDSPEVTLWESSTSAIVGWFSGHDGPVFDIAFDAEGGTLATAGGDHTQSC
ncbi:MAG TPA: hypothetical protein VGO16_07800 [Pseudonocardiaceae bacterium]|jgi:WD40 repeat protein|nr:hypothetical protein [Pseudonocardiaceae bacterium]